ncbi:MAG: glutaredoxin 3 [Chloroflexota bacterium]
MAKVEIYSSFLCGFCARAKALLGRKGVKYGEVDVMEHPERREEMRRRAGGRNTVPQIFIDGVHVGGSDDLLALEEAGKLDPLLAK